MIYDKDSFLNPESRRLRESYAMLQGLRRLNGGYLASPNPGKPDGTGRYDVFWLRDIMYGTYANEYIGRMRDMIESYELVMTIMLKYKHKICKAIRKLPEKAALHARFHPTTLEELTPDWGHHQLDAYGLFLYKTGDLIKKGYYFIDTIEERELIKDVISYVFNYRWETVPDFGMWEEGPELHSSSIGSVLAGLTMWFDDGHYQHKYRHGIDLSTIAPVSERYFDTGRDELYKLLPRESASRKVDMAQLSLVWPYNIIDKDMRDTIVRNVEGNLVRDHGVIRYEGDHYFNSDPDNKVGNEAQWPLGLAWLAIIHNKYVEWGAGLKEGLEHLKKSREYLRKIDSLMVDGAIPELFVDGEPNQNRPLAWAHSFHVIALQSFINSVDSLRQRNNVEITEDLTPA